MWDPITNEDENVGLPTYDTKALLDLAEMMSTGRPSLILHQETVARLRKWTDYEDEA